MRHKEAIQTLERIMNEQYLPEVCERHFLNHNKLRVELVEGTNFHSMVVPGFPCVIKLNIEARGDEINTLLNNSLKLIKKYRLDQPFPLVPKEYFQDSVTGTRKWGRRTIKQQDRKGTQMLVNALPRKDINYKQVIVTEATDTVTGITVRTEEVITDVSKMSPSIWIRLTENVRDYEDEQEKKEIKDMVANGDTPELNEALNNNAANLQN